MGIVEGKIALVTGGSSGIGAAAASIFAREGARVVISDIDAESGAATAKSLSAEGAPVTFFPADVSSEEDVSLLVQHCVDLHGRIDCAFNNAGVSSAASPLHDIELVAWQRTLDINLTGVFLCMKYEIPVMLKQGGGAIVNTASGAGLIATPWMSPYCASKHAILGITKTAAVENAQTGVRVNAVCPGSTDTPMLQGAMSANESIKKMILSSIPMGRLGTAEEIAEAAVWLCSDRASYVSGESLVVDGAAVCR